MSARVLIVDDAAFMRHLIRNILKDIGCEVVGEAENGELACSAYEELKPDLVTMDLIMPVKGGLDALKDIRASDPSARVIIISAIDQRGPLMEAIKSGAADYVVKPFDQERVKEVIGRVVATVKASA